MDLTDGNLEQEGSCDYVLSCRHLGEVSRVLTECIRFNWSAGGAWSCNTEIQTKHSSQSLYGFIGLPPL